MIKSDRINASDMGQAVLFDPQFKLPKYPLISKNLVNIHIQNGIIFDGTDMKQILRGKATEEFIPRLITYLDGNNSLEDIIKTFHDYSEQNIIDALSLMYVRGLLQEGHQKDLIEYDSSFINYLERFIDYTRVNPSLDDSLSKIEETEIILYCSEDYIDIMTTLLSKYNIDCVLYTEGYEKNESKNSLAIAIHDVKSDMKDLGLLDKHMAEQDIPWVLVALNENDLFLGPYFSREETICFDCFLHQVDIEEGRETNEISLVTGLSYAISEIINLVTRIGPIHITKGVKCLNLITFNSEMINISKVSYCPECDRHENKSPTLNKVIEFEDYISFPSYRFINPKDHQIHYQPGNLELRKISKTFVSYPNISLSLNQDLPELDSLKYAQPNLSSLTKILLYSNGYKSDEKGNLLPDMKRWAPTGGNLGSTEVYFINKGIEGLDLGTYYYQTKEHSLARLSNKQTYEEFEHYIHNPSFDGLGYLILTGDIVKVKQKYNDFAYKITHLDAGVALTQLKIVAKALNIEVNIHDFADNEIEQYLNLKYPNEIITLVLSLREVRE